MLNKRGTGEEAPLIVVIEILLAISVGFLFVDRGKAFASQEIFYKQEVASELGLAIEALAGISGDASLGFDNLYKYVITIDNNKVEVGTQSHELISGTYYFVPFQGASINPAKNNFENPVNFFINKQGTKIFVDDKGYDGQKLSCSNDKGLTKIRNVAVSTSPSSPQQDQEILQSVIAGLQSSSVRIDSSSKQVQQDTLLIALGTSTTKGANSIKAYISFDSPSSAAVACFILNQMMDKVSADNYYIIPVDANRLETNDPKSILKDNKFSIYLELGNPGSARYDKNPSEMAASILKGIEEYNP